MRIIGVREVDPSILSISKNNIRKNVDEDSIESLADSMLHHGQVQPIIANTNNEVIAGQRRLLAARKAGLKTVRVEYREYDSEAEEILDSIIENLHQEAIDSRDLAHALKRLNKEYGLTYDELALKAGIDRGTLGSILRSVTVPYPLQIHEKSGSEEEKKLARKIKIELEEAPKRRQDLLKRVANMSPYKEDLYELSKFIDWGMKAPLHDLEEAVKEIKETKVPIDVEARKKYTPKLTQEKLVLITKHIPKSVWKEFLEVAKENRIDATKALIQAIEEWTEKHRIMV